MNTHNRIQRQAIGLLIGYVVQFFAGMLLNLFVTIPEEHPGANGKDYFASSGHGLSWALSGQGGVALAVHAYIALALALGSLGLFVASIWRRDKLWSWCSGLAAFSTVGAFFNGLSFIDYGHDFSSMIMASCWMVAVGALVYGLIVANKLVVMHNKNVSRSGYHGD